MSTTVNMFECGFVYFYTSSSRLISQFERRREKEQRKINQGKSDKAPSRKRSPSKKEPPKKRGRKDKQTEEPKSDEDEDYEEDLPDTSGDAALAESMAGKRVSTRNLDAKGNKFKRAAALAKIREVRADLHHAFFISLCHHTIKCLPYQ